MRLTGQQKAALKEAILKAYNEEDLETLLREGMEISYDEIRRGNTYTNRVANLIVDIEKTEKAAEFISKIVEKRPNSPDLNDFKIKFSIGKNNNEQATAKKEEFYNEIKQLSISLEYKGDLEQGDWEIHPIDSRTIKTKAQNLGISEEDVEIILEEIRKPYKNYQNNITAEVKDLEDTINQDDDLANYLARTRKAVKDLNIDPKIASMIYSHRGRSLYREKKLEKSIIIFQEALELDPSNAECYSDLGMALYKLGHVDNALENLEIAKILFQQEEKDDMVKQIEIVTEQLKNFKN